MLKLRTECDVIDSDSNKDVDVHTDVNIVIVSIEYIQMYRWLLYKFETLLSNRILCGNIFVIFKDVFCAS